MEKGQGEKLGPIIENVVAKAGVKISALTAIGVGIGPGNFTGIRIGVATARGLALATGIKAVGVNGFEALALGTDYPTVSMIKARQGYVYVQSFTDTGAGTPCLIPLDDIANYCPGLNVTWISTNDKDQIPRTPHIAKPVFPMAIAIARIAAMRWQNDPPRPAPLYLRPPTTTPAQDRGPAILL